MREINLLVVHCSASSPKVDADVAMITRWHRLRGFLTIGYHYVIRRSGELQKGRPEEQIGAHVEGYNKNSLGICMVGGVNEMGKPANNFTPAQWESLKTLLYQLKIQHPDARICGHRDLPNVHKDCPSFDVATWLKEIQFG